VNVQVGTLTVRGSRRDDGFRARAESRLRSLDLHPPGLPGHAILIVRRLELPAADRTSAQQARSGLDRLRQAAARPADGLVAASAPAVLFRDEVELLACLTADLVRGAASHRWYWRQIVPARPAGPGAALSAAWLRDVRWLPGSLARLREPEVRQAVSLLSPPETDKVLRALLSAFGVADEPVPPGSGLTRLPPEPPWRQWLRPTSLPPEAEALWGVALSLHHGPAVVRGAGYASELAAWRAVTGRAVRFPSAAPGDLTCEGLTRGASAREDPAGEASAERDPEKGAPAERDPRPRQSGRGATLAADPAGAGRIGRTVPSHGLGDGRAPRAEGHPEAGAPPAAAGRAGAPSPRAPGSTESSPADVLRVAGAGTPAWADGGIATGLASMLFLVNFVVWLDDLAAPPWPAGWALVELLGRYLLGGRLADFADDPLWDVLAELDGRRPGTVPAVGFGPADPVRLPRAWLERWPPPTPSYVARRNRDRLVVRHRQAGFVAADVPCPAGVLDQVRAAEAAWLGDVGVAADGPAEPENPAPRRRFDEAVGVFVRWLLRSRGISTSALTAPGRVLVTGTHVDAVLSLQDIDLSVRVAGLDRDPGWVPQLGRIVLFHFLDAPGGVRRRLFAGMQSAQEVPERVVD
jgi:hypothetical protein